MSQSGGPYYYINAESIWSYTSESYAAHLREIRNHWSRLKRKRKADAKARQEEYKPKAKDYTFKYTKTGKPSIIIRKRKPQFLYESEYKELITQYPKEDVDQVLAARSISCKPDPDKETK